AREESVSENSISGGGTAGNRFLLPPVDQRNATSRRLRYAEGEDAENDTFFPFQPSEISYLFLTHAHIDHSGLIPKLVKDGFRGRIITTGATADLVKIMLYDSAHIQEKDAEWKTKKALRQGKEQVVEPLYTTKDVEAAIPFFEKKRYGETGHLGKGFKYVFLDAGHILGSSSFVLSYQDTAAEKKIVFSGDIEK